MFGAVNLGQTQWEIKPEGSDKIIFFFLKDAYFHLGTMLVPTRKQDFIEGTRKCGHVIIDSQSHKSDLSNKYI